MEQWKEYKLGDISKNIFAGGDASKFSCKKNKTDMYFIPIYANAIENDGLYGYTNTAVVSEPAVTIAARGAGTGNVIYRSKPFTPIVRLISIIPNENVNPLFLACALQLKKLSGDGSAIPQLTVPEVRKITINIPSLNTQNKIANFVEKINQKITLNRRINDNLEQQAQALFKSWFVDFEPFKDGEFVDSELGMIPKGWRVVCLGEVTKQVTEKVGNREDVTVLSPVNSGELVLSEEYFTKQVFSKNLSKYLIVNPLSFAYNPARINIGSIGLNEYDFVGCVSPVYVVFKCEPNYHYFFDFYKRTAVFKDEVALRAIGGVRQSLGYDDFSLIKTIYPTPDVVAEFNNLYLKMKEVITRNDIQNNKLTTLRDSLLPKLMSGELKINNFNR